MDDADFPEPVGRTSVGSVPVFFAEGPAPLQAALVFRLGLVDEVLATFGTTHLVEHLALSSLSDQPYRYNGAVEGLRTVFAVAGSPAEIGHFFGTVTTSLRRLPLDRLPTEARILRTEAASRRRGHIDHMLGSRYGPRRWGLRGYPEYGLNDPDPSAVQAWADQWFTAGNAALWVSGSDFPSFELELPSGPRKDIPDLPIGSFQLPGWFSAPSDGIGICMVAACSTTFSLLGPTLYKRARTRLRYGEGVSYEVSINYLPLSRDFAHFTVWADALPESALAVASGLLELVDELAANGPQAEELTRELTIARRALADPTMVFSLLNGAVESELLGTKDLSPTQLFQELETATPQDLARQLSRACETAIVVVPDGIEMPAPRFTRLPGWSASHVRGRRYDLRKPTLDPNDAYWLIVSDEGISIVRASGKFVTVLYRDCAALLRWADGTRTLIGNDGFVVDVRPDQIRGAQELPWEIDYKVSPSVYVPMGEDDLGHVSIAASGKRAPRSLRTLAPGLLVVAVLLCWFGVLGGLFAGSRGTVLIYLPPAIIGTAFVVYRYRPGTFASVADRLRRR